jgi:hypothetical protein
MGALSSNWKAWAVGIASGALACYSIGLLYEGFISERYSGLLTYPFVDKPAAERAYDRLGSSAAGPERAIAAQRLVTADPASPESWNAVAFDDWLAHGRRLSPAGLTALDHSYAVSFFDRPSAVWRICFALENWAEMTPELRKDVMAEAAVALKDPRLGPELRDRAKSVQGPEGRLAALMIVGSSPL